MCEKFKVEMYKYQHQISQECEQEFARNSKNLFAKYINIYIFGPANMIKHLGFCPAKV